MRPCAAFLEKARWAELCLPALRHGGRAWSTLKTALRPALPQVPPEHRADGGNSDGSVATLRRTVMVLGRLSVPPGTDARLERESAFRAVSAATWSRLRRPFKFSTSCAGAGCGPTKTGSVDSPRTMVRWTKPGLAGERVGRISKAVVTAPQGSRLLCHRGASSKARAPRSTTGKNGRWPDAFGSPSCRPYSPPSLAVGSSKHRPPGSLIVTDDWSGYRLGKRL